MFGLRPLACGIAASLVIVSAADAQQAGAKRVAAAEPLPAAAPAVAPPTAPQDPVGAALQQKLSLRVRAEEGEAQDRAALVGYYASQAFKPLWVTSSGLNARAQQVIAELGKANDWGLEAADFPAPAVVAAAGDPHRCAEIVRFGRDRSLQRASSAATDEFGND